MGIGSLTPIPQQAASFPSGGSRQWAHRSLSYPAKLGILFHLLCKSALYPVQCRKPAVHRVKSGFTQRSEEHTSELQSRPHLVCRLLLEKKNQYNSNPQHSNLTIAPP